MQNILKIVETILLEHPGNLHSDTRPHTLLWFQQAHYMNILSVKTPTKIELVRLQKDRLRKQKEEVPKSNTYD